MMKTMKSGIKGSTMIKEVVVRGKFVSVRYESERWIEYAKKEDIPRGLKGVRVLPDSVVRFMREHPERVR